LNSINKWARGAIARRQFRKLVLTMQIAGLKYPEYQGEKLEKSDKPLLTEKELFLQLSWEADGKDLYWNNFFVDIGKNKK